MKKIIKLPKSWDESYSDQYGFYQCSNGAFGVGTHQYERGYGSAPIDWHHCRDELHWEYKTINILLFKSTYGDKIIAFIGHIEDKLKLKKKDRAEINNTNLKNVLHIKLGSFWRQIDRRSLFTALLRAARHYKSKTEKGFWSAIKNTNYFWQKGSLYAFQRFIEGNTTIKRDRWSNYNDDGYFYGDVRRGWVQRFGKLTEKEIDRKIVK